MPMDSRMIDARTSDARNAPSFDANAPLPAARDSDAAAGLPEQTMMAKRSVVIAGHKTSVSLEHAFWTALKAAANRRRMTVNQLVTEIDGRRSCNLSSAIRVFLLAEAGRINGIDTDATATGHSANGRRLADHLVPYVPGLKT